MAEGEEYVRSWRCGGKGRPGEHRGRHWCQYTARGEQWVRESTIVCKLLGLTPQGRGVTWLRGCQAELEFQFLGLILLASWQSLNRQGHRRELEKLEYPLITSFLTLKSFP